MDLLGEIVTALKARERVVLATIISSSGSTPLPTGSSMLICEHGMRALGTVGGGLLEAKVTREAKERFAAAGESVIKEFDLNESGSEEGMICGGNVDVLIEKIGEDALDVFSQLVALRSSGQDCVLLRRIDLSGVVSRIVLEESDERAPNLKPLRALLHELGIEPETFLQQVQRSQREEYVERLATRGVELIIQPISGIQALVICGGGHVGRSVSKVAAATGFAVTIVDDREDYATPARCPEAAATISGEWSDALSKITITRSMSIVIVTRAHQSDKEVLRLVIDTPARYIGMIGSGKKVRATFDSLRQEGVPVETLRRVHAPIGLHIGAVTAEEIAISIVAELVRHRRRFYGASFPLSEKTNRWFEDAT
ncbi:MAG: XdhC family protein [Ignavibacteriales bacterium]|nr:XdhC family protein [Ignavibacteriales bacterium]